MPFFAIWGRTAFALLMSAGIPHLLGSKANSIFAAATTPTPEENLREAVSAVLLRQYAGLDTAALMQALKQREQWGESDARFTEAQAILHFDQGQWEQALILVRRINRPSATALALYAECMERKGEIYEAASLHLRAGRELPSGDLAKGEHFRRYLEIFPDKAGIRLEMAAAYAAAGQALQASEAYLREEAAWIQDPVRVKQVMENLELGGRLGDLEGLLRRARNLHPRDSTLTAKHARLLERLGEKHRAAETWMELWTQYPQAVEMGPRALALFQASGDQASIRAALETAAQLESENPDWHFRLAQACLQGGDTACAYREILPLIAKHRQNIVFTDILLSALNGDDQIQEHFTLLKANVDLNHSPVTLLAKLARGYSLARQSVDACRHWLQVRKRDPLVFLSHVEAAQDLTACRDREAKSALAELMAKPKPTSGAAAGLAAEWDAAKAAIAAKEYGEAAICLRRIVAVNPEDRAAWESLGNSLALVPDLKAAAEPLQKAIDLGSEQESVLINRARAYRNEGEHDMAESILSFLLGENPKSYLALIWSAHFAKIDDEPKLAEALYRQADLMGLRSKEWEDLIELGLKSAP